MTNGLLFVSWDEFSWGGGGTNTATKDLQYEMGFQPHAEGTTKLGGRINYILTEIFFEPVVNLQEILFEAADLAVCLSVFSSQAMRPKLQGEDKISLAIINDISDAVLGQLLNCISHTIRWSTGVGR